MTVQDNSQKLAFPTLTYSGDAEHTWPRQSFFTVPTGEIWYIETVRWYAEGSVKNTSGYSGQRALRGHFHIQLDGTYESTTSVKFWSTHPSSNSTETAAQSGKAEVGEYIHGNHSNEVLVNVQATQGNVDGAEYNIDDCRVWVDARRIL